MSKEKVTGTFVSLKERQLLRKKTVEKVYNFRIKSETDKSSI